MRSDFFFEICPNCIQSHLIMENKKNIITKCLSTTWSGLKTSRSSSASQVGELNTVAYLFLIWSVIIIVVRIIVSIQFFFLIFASSDHHENSNINLHATDFHFRRSLLFCRTR